MRANDLAITAPTPKIFRACGAYSRDEPSPQLRPAHEQVAGANVLSKFRTEVREGVTVENVFSDHKRGVLAGQDVVGVDRIAEPPDSGHHTTASSDSGCAR